MAFEGTRSHTHRQAHAHTAQCRAVIYSEVEKRLGSTLEAACFSPSGGDCVNSLQNG